MEDFEFLGLGDGGGVKPKGRVECNCREGGVVGVGAHLLMTRGKGKGGGKGVGVVGDVFSCCVVRGVLE